MTKYVLHGGFAIGGEQENDQFFREILADTPAELKILLVYFAKDEDRINDNSEEAQAGFTDDAILFRREHTNILLEETLKRIIMPIRQIVG